MAQALTQGPPGIGESATTKVMPPNEDADNPIYKQDQFRMYCLKVLPCSKRYCHDWTTCPFAHPAEKAKRRDPRVYQYTGVACPEMKKNLACPRGDACPYAHNVFEYWLHPSRYRTQLCNDGVQCRRKICFFAHTLDELRVSSVKVMNPDLAGRDGFGDVGGLDPFAVANDTGFGLARGQPSASSTTPGFSLQDLQQLTHLHAKLQAASSLGTLNGMLAQQVQGVGNGDVGQSQVMDQLTHALAGQQQQRQQHMGGPQQQQADDLVALMSQLLVSNQQQQQAQQQAQQQQAAAAAAAVAAAQNQAALQLLSQLQAAGAFGQEQMAGFAAPPPHMSQNPHMPRTAIPPALLQQQLAVQLAAQNMSMQGRPAMQNMGGQRSAPQQVHGYGHAGAAARAEQEAVAKLVGLGLAHGGANPGAMQAQLGSSPRQMPAPRIVQGNTGTGMATSMGMATSLGMATSPMASLLSGRSSGVIGDQLATSPASLAHSPALGQGMGLGGLGLGPQRAPMGMRAGVQLPDLAGTAGTATTYFSSHSPASTDHSDAGSHRSDHSDAGSGGVARSSMPPPYLL